MSSGRARRSGARVAAAHAPCGVQAAATRTRLTFDDDELAKRLLAWFDVHGRRNLPWQRERTPYSVWVAEIMLQQTQVATVVAYYERFMRRFPTISSLAAAPLDEVLALWSGLGYYARARNLHRAAVIVAERCGGRLPETFDELVSLPGIGRSTAGAVLAQSRGMRLPILDGNAKRVLARVHAVDGWPGDPRVARDLWAHAERHTPNHRVADYTQAIMDLGATLCTRVRPGCTRCPLVSGCLAYAEGSHERLPAPRPKRVRPTRRVSVLVVQAPDGRVLLERRPPSGVWGGLYSLPELDESRTASEWCAAELGAEVLLERPLETIAHAFTHFDLDLEPLLVKITPPGAGVADRDHRRWWQPGEALTVGVPAPIAALGAALGRGEAPSPPPVDALADPAVSLHAAAPRLA